MTITAPAEHSSRALEPTVPGWPVRTCMYIEEEVHSEGMEVRGGRKGGREVVDH